MEVDKLDAVADRGYFNSEEILACEEAGITVTLPKPMTSDAKAEGRFGKQDFVYVADEDVYRLSCRREARLPLHERGKRHRRCAATGPTPARRCAIKTELHHRQGATDHAMGA